MIIDMMKYIPVWKSWKGEGKASKSDELLKFGIR
jgi:hypothetical protein